MSGGPEKPTSIAATLTSARILTDSGSLHRKIYARGLGVPATASRSGRLCRLHSVEHWRRTTPCGDSAVGDVRFASLGLQKLSAAAASRGHTFASKTEPPVISPCARRLKVLQTWRGNKWAHTRILQTPPTCGPSENILIQHVGTCSAVGLSHRRSPQNEVI